MLNDGPSADAVYAQLYEAHAGAVLQYLTYQLRDPETAEDIAQNTWERAHKFLPGTLANGRGVNKAWLMRIAANAMTDHWRRVQARPQTTGIDDALAPGSAFPDTLMDRETPERITLAEAQHDDVRAQAAVVLELLPARWRLLLWLREWRRYSNEQIATVLKAEVSAVKKQLGQAREAQRIVWERNHGRSARREGVVDRAWQYIAGGRTWALAHGRDCWLWTGGCCSSGGRRVPSIQASSYRPYSATLRRVPQRHVVASRLFYAMLRGVLPPWAALSRRCDEARCVNPTHYQEVYKAGAGRGFRPGDPALDRPDVGGAHNGGDAPDWLTAGAMRQRRHALGLSVHRLAAEAGVGSDCVCRIEGRLLVTPNVLHAVAAALHRLEARLSPVVSRTPAELIAWRTRFGFSQRDLSAQAHIAHRALARFEQGARGFSLASSRKLHDTLTRLEAELTPLTIHTPATLKSRRLALGLFQRELSTRARVDVGSILRFETGKQSLRPSSLRRLQDALDRLEREREERAA